MALRDEELYKLGVVRAPFPRLVASGGIPGGTEVASFDTHSEAVTLPVGTPLGRVDSSGRLAPFDQDGTPASLDEIVAFVYPFEIELSATEEVHGVVLVRGTVHRDDINTAEIRAVTGDQDGLDPATEQELDDALLALKILPGSNIEVQGLDLA